MNAAAQLQKAIIRENSGDLAGAMAEYQKVVRRDPGNIDALFLLGRGHCQQGDFEPGAQAFRKIIKLRPGHAPAHTLLGMVLFRLGKMQDALDNLECALAADPQFELALANKGDVLTEVGRHSEAVREYDKALAINAGNVAVLCNRGNALQTLERDAEAVESFRRALALNPNLPEAHFNIANALRKLKCIEDAVAHYRRAITLRPGLADAHINLSSVLTALRRWQEVAGVSERAVRLRPNSALAHCNLAVALIELGRYDESRAHLDLALAIDPEYARALFEKARLMLYTGGQMAEAQAFVERAIEINPTDVGCYQLLADIKRFTPGDPVIARMEGLLHEAATADQRDLARLHFSLAKVYRDIEQHEGSFECLLKGNTLARQQFDYDEGDVLGSVEAIRKIFTEDFLSGKAGYGNVSTQPIFIVGMLRSGTTLIEQILASHPNVHGAGERPDFRNAILNVAGPASPEYPELVPTLTPTQISEIGAKYLSTMTASMPAVARFADKLPGNFLLIGLIYLALPNARIIHARRNPVDTCLSCFSIDFREPVPYAYDLGELGRYYRAYDRLMHYWHDVLPEGAMLEVQYEDVVADLETQARRIIAYCGLEWDNTCLAFHKTARPVATASAAQVRQPIYGTSVERWRRYGDQLKPLLEALEVTD